VSGLSNLKTAGKMLQTTKSTHQTTPVVEPNVKKVAEMMRNYY
jgi:hypothetical protein